MSHSHGKLAGYGIAAGLIIGSVGLALAQDAPVSSGGYAVVGANGKLRHNLNVTSVNHAGPGIYRIRFNQNVDRCAANATIRGEKRSTLPGYIVVSSFDDRTLQVNTFLTTTLLPADFRFDVTATC